MEITYRRTVQVREYESITIEVKETTDEFTEGIRGLEKLVDKELARHCDVLRKRYALESSEDEVDLS